MAQRKKSTVKKLIKNIWKKFKLRRYRGSWLGLDDAELLRWLYRETTELIEAVESGDYVKAMDEAGDVSLIALYYADPERIQNIRRAV